MCPSRACLKNALAPGKSFHLSQTIKSISETEHFFNIMFEICADFDIMIRVSKGLNFPFTHEKEFIKRVLLEKIYVSSL